MFLTFSMWFSQWYHAKQFAEGKAEGKVEVRAEGIKFLKDHGYHAADRSAGSPGPRAGCPARPSAKH
jgi:hypothetical protein